MAQPNSSRTTADASSGGSTAGGTSYDGNAGTGSGQRDTTIVGRVRERAEATLESQKDRATDGLGSVARAVRGTEEQLRSQHQESIADYVAQVAERIDRFSGQLRDKRVNELLDDAQQFARRHPAAFAGSAFAVGLVAARFLKSSGDQSRNGSGYGDDTFGGNDERRYGASYRSPRQQDHASQHIGTSSARSSVAAGDTSPGGTPGTAVYGSVSGSSLPPSPSGATRGSASGTLSSDRGSDATSGATGSNATGGTRGRRTGSETERS